MVLGLFGSMFNLLRGGIEDISFVQTKSLCEIASMFFIYSFLSFVNCHSKPCIDNKLSKSNDIVIIPWHLPYGMPITKIILIYNNRLTL